MITEREEKLLWDMEDISESNLDLFTDDEIKDNIKCFLTLKTFKESKRAVSILMTLTEEEIKDLDLWLINIPDKLKFEEALILMGRGVTITNDTITRKYTYELLSKRENIIKYKHLLNLDTIVREKLWLVCRHENVLDNLVEVCYDEIKNITTGTLLESLKVDLGEDCPNYAMSILLDRINSSGNREFKDDTIIKKLLGSIRYKELIKNDEDIFAYFDEDYICKNVEYFNPFHLNKVGKLTEKILQAYINNPNIWNIYRFGFSIDNPLIELSSEFMVKNYKKLDLHHICSCQKNVVDAYKKIASRDKESASDIDLMKIYLVNPNLSEEDLEWLRNELKDKTHEEFAECILSKCPRSELALERLVKMGCFNNV